MKIIVCGGRDFQDRASIFSHLDHLLAIANQEHDDIHVIAGGARGADTIAKSWAIYRNQEFTEIIAQWDIYGKRAGYLRNVKMAEEQPDLVVAFPGGRGTSQMIGIARKMGIPVLQIDSDGESKIE